mgnify:CR=1 FL=1
MSEVLPLTPPWQDGPLAGGPAPGRQAPGTCAGDGVGVDRGARSARRAACGLAGGEVDGYRVSECGSGSVASSSRRASTI